MRSRMQFPPVNGLPMMQGNPMLQLLQGMQSGGNPMQMLERMAAQNPAMQQAMPLIQGKNAKQLEETARNMAAQRGIDIDAFSAQIRQMMPRR